MAKQEENRPDDSATYVAAPCGVNPASTLSDSDTLEFWVNGNGTVWQGRMGTLNRQYEEIEG